DCNGTLERLTARAVRLCRGRAALLPILFFFLGFVLATIGAGAVPASALLAPPAMAVAARAGIAPFLMAVMAGNGALAGTLSPFAPTGIVAHGVMARIGLGGVEWQTFAYNAVAHAVVGFGGFLLFGGWRLFTGRGPTLSVSDSDEVTTLEARHWLTTAGILALVVFVVGVGTDVGSTALIISVLLILLRAGDEQRAIQRMPWGVLLMVTGVTVLISLMQETRGLDLFTQGIARISTADSIVPIVAFGTGVISVYSSTSGVVLPAFLPMAPELAGQLGEIEALNIA